MKDCSEYHDVMDKLVEIKDSLKIDIDKIITKKNDSIIYFKKELLSKDTKEYIKFDFFISFSRIAFNKDFTKSIVKVSTNRSKLAGFSAIYFLEKKDSIWKVKCIKELSIS